MINDAQACVKYVQEKFYEVFSQVWTIKNNIEPFIQNTSVQIVTIYERSLYG